MTVLVRTFVGNGCLNARLKLGLIASTLLGQKGLAGVPQSPCRYCFVLILMNAIVVFFYAIAISLSLRVAVGRDIRTGSCIRKVMTQ